MKKLNLQILLLLIAIYLPTSIFAQDKVPIDIIVGVGNSFDITLENGDARDYAITSGLFVQFQIGEYFSMETSMSFSERRYKRRAVGYCATGFSERDIEILGITDTKFRALEIDQLLKLHVVNTKRASYFLGLGGLVRLPLGMKVKPLDTFFAGPREVEVENEILNRMWGVKFAVGMDYDFNEKFQLSTQMGWNKINGSSLFNGRYSHAFVTNLDSGFLKVSLGYQL